MDRRLLPAPDAAAYLGISETTLRGLELRRRVLGGKRLYERADLDRYADALPYDRHGGDTWDEQEADAVFGR